MGLVGPTVWLASDALKPSDALANIYPNARLRTDAEALAVFGRDRTTSYQASAHAIVFPETIEEVVQTVACARANRFALVPSGGRTGLSGGAMACNGEVVIALDRMNKILSFSATDRLVTCQAGVITQVLQDYAQSHDLFYPVDFASAGSSQIGGNIATNAGGIKVIRYGLTREWVAGLTVVTGCGDVLRCNNGLIKNATGYDIRQLMIGSEGTLGIVVEAQIRLTDQPKEQQVMVLGVNAFTDVVEVQARFARSLQLSAFEFFSELSLQKVLAHRGGQRPLDKAYPFYALLEYDAVDETSALETFTECVTQGIVHDGTASQSRQQAANLWALREDISESLAPEHPYKNDVAVRVGDVAAFLAQVDALVEERYPDLEVCWYGHIGDGNLHLNILKPAELTDEAFYARCHRISPELFAIVQSFDGSVSAEHGVGLLKKDYLGYSRSNAEIELMRGIKKVFDPDGVMNPGKVF